MSIASDNVRKTFKESDDIRDAGLVTPDYILRYDDIIYGEDKIWQVLDVYRPKDAKGRLPVIISVHGGGWVYGDKERYQFYCMDLAKRGFAVINFTYRLAPEHKFPAPIEDTNSVVSWMLKNAEEYQFDTDNLFAVGDSAGAHILSLYAAICTNPEYASNFTFKLPETSFRFKALALNCGAYEVGHSLDLMSDYLPNKGTQEEIKLVTVPNYITPDYPSVFLMTATDDFLCGQPPLMAEQLTKCKVPFIYRMYGSKDNPLSHVFHCNIRSEDARICNDEECGYFKSLIS